jgi:hypothetical protein
MKKILAIAAVIILTASIVKAQAGWITHKADNRISVKFPAEPSDKVPGSLIATSADSSCVFVFTMVDFLEVANVDSVALAPVKDTPEFAAQLKTGVLEKLQGVNLADFTIGKWKGFTSYTSGGTDSILRRYDMFMVIIGNKLYSFSTVTRSGSSLEGRDTFLNSIELSN